MLAENRRDWNRDRVKHYAKFDLQYYGMVKHLDDCVGRMLAKLEAEGILDDTLVLFTTDHGDLMGERG